MPVALRPNLALRLPMQLLIATGGALGFSQDLPVVLVGPALALPDSGPHTASVQNPLPGVTYHWSIASGTGTLLGTTGTTASFRTGSGPETLLTCQAQNLATGETGSGTHRLLRLTPGPVQQVRIQAPDLAGKSQGPLVAWVENPLPGFGYYWHIEGGEALSAPAANHLLFQTGTGNQVRLRCDAALEGVVANQATQKVILLDAAPARKPAFTIATVVKAPRGKAGLQANVEGHDAANHAYQWSIEGGHPQEQAGGRFHWTAGNGARAVVTCLATNLGTGAMALEQKDITLVPAVAMPVVELPKRIYEGQSKVARVKNSSAEGCLDYTWTLSNLEREQPGLEGPDPLVVPFRAPRAGAAILSCLVTDMHTLETKTWTQCLEILPAQALVPAARILDFRCDPSGPLKPETMAATLTWTLDKDPEALVLREVRTGRLLPVKSTDRSHTVTGPWKGRQTYSLTTIIRDPDREEDATATRTVEIVVPGVTVLAGDAEHLGSSYMKAFSEGVTPWAHVTGLAWKGDWLYFSQGGQHTIRRVHLSGGDVEEVAGMRAIPGKGTANQDLLFEPGQLLHRSFIDVQGQPVEDWLVLQPGANCIQSFQEGQVAATRKLLGTFNRKAVPGGLNRPTAMAVHAATGQVFVADHGNGEIKRYAPRKDQHWATLAVSVEANGLAVNDRGDLFYADASHHVIKVMRLLNPPLRPDLGLEPVYAPAELFAGAMDQAGSMDGHRTAAARFRFPTGLAMDTAEQARLLIADTGNHLVRSVPADLSELQEVETIGGNPCEVMTNAALRAVHPSGIVARLDAEGLDLKLFSADGLSSQALPGPLDFKARGIALDLDGNLFLADPGQHVVWSRQLLTPLGLGATYGPPKVFAGSVGHPGKAGGLRLAQARFRSPTGLTLDPRDPRPSSSPMPPTRWSGRSRWPWTRNRR
jgi:hypothetical protein